MTPDRQALYNAHRAALHWRRKERMYADALLVRQDQVRYSRATVESFLPAVWDEEFILRPPKNNVELGVRVKSRPPEALNEWQLGVADVVNAFHRADLGLDERYILGRREKGWSHGDIAFVLQLPPADVARIEYDAITKITNWLNGKR